MTSVASKTVCRVDCPERKGKINSVCRVTHGLCENIRKCPKDAVEGEFNPSNLDRYYNEAGYTKLKLDNGIEVTVDKKAPETRCACGDMIVWCITRTGKRMPIKQDEVTGGWYSHFADCKMAERFRNRRRL